MIRQKYTIKDQAQDILLERDTYTIITPRKTDAEGFIELRWFREVKRKKKSEILHFEEILPRFISISKTESLLGLKKRILSLVGPAMNSLSNLEEVTDEVLEKAI